jgi:hypothetical protein
MAAHGKHPHLAGNKTWDWWAYLPGHADPDGRARLAHAALDVPLFELLTAAMCGSGWSSDCAYREHPTRRDAEADLADALWRQRYPGVAS